MKYMPEEVWRSQAKDGRENFIWKKRVVPFGIPIGLAGVGWGAYEMELGWSGLLSPWGAVLIAVAVLLGIISAYMFAKFEWEDHVAHYKTPRERSSDSDDSDE